MKVQTKRYCKDGILYQWIQAKSPNGDLQEEEHITKPKPEERNINPNDSLFRPTAKEQEPPASCRTTMKQRLVVVHTTTSSSTLKNGNSSSKSKHIQTKKKRDVRRHTTVDELNGEERHTAFSPKNRSIDRKMSWFKVPSGSAPTSGFLPPGREQESSTAQRPPQRGHSPVPGRDMRSSSSKTAPRAEEVVTSDVSFGRTRNACTSAAAQPCSTTASVPRVTAAERDRASDSSWLQTAIKASVRKFCAAARALSEQASDRSSADSAAPPQEGLATGVRERKISGVETYREQQESSSSQLVRKDVENHVENQTDVFSKDDEDVEMMDVEMLDAAPSARSVDVRPTFGGAPGSTSSSTAGGPAGEPASSSSASSSTSSCPQQAPELPSCCAGPDTPAQFTTISMKTTTTKKKFAPRSKNKHFREEQERQLQEEQEKQAREQELQRLKDLKEQEEKKRQERKQKRRELKRQRREEEKRKMQERLLVEQQQRELQEALLRDAEMQQRQREEQERLEAEKQQQLLLQKQHDELQLSKKMKEKQRKQPLLCRTGPTYVELVEILDPASYEKLGLQFGIDLEFAYVHKKGGHRWRLDIERTEKEEREYAMEVARQQARGEEVAAMASESEAETGRGGEQTGGSSCVGRSSSLSSCGRGGRENRGQDELQQGNTATNPGSGVLPEQQNPQELTDGHEHHQLQTEQPHENSLQNVNPKSLPPIRPRDEEPPLRRRSKNVKSDPKRRPISPPGNCNNQAKNLKLQGLDPPPFFPSDSKPINRRKFTLPYDYDSHKPRVFLERHIVPFHMPVHWNEDLEDYYETFTGKPVVPCYEKFCDAAANLGIKVNQLLKHRAKEIGRCCKLFNLLDHEDFRYRWELMSDWEREQFKAKRFDFLKKYKPIRLKKVRLAKAFAQEERTGPPSLAKPKSGNTKDEGGANVEVDDKDKGEPNDHIKAIVDANITSTTAAPVAGEGGKVELGADPAALNDQQENDFEERSEGQQRIKKPVKREVSQRSTTKAAAKSVARGRGRPKNDASNASGPGTRKATNKK
ncbi:unnamed protein product [Amoebophrya sp. A120]|nr:unnamed protein product [Amoebophrya sp. A120]|eukprot:GSA120T00009784001.1